MCSSIAVILSYPNVCFSSRCIWHGHQTLDAEITCPIVLKYLAAAPEGQERADRLAMLQQKWANTAAITAGLRGRGLTVREGFECVYDESFKDKGSLERKMYKIHCGLPYVKKDLTCAELLDLVVARKFFGLVEVCQLILCGLVC